MMAPVKKEYPVEAMKMEPMKIEYPIAKTFIQYPTLRSPSLEAFVKERETSSCPASRMASIDEDDEATNVPNSPTNTSVNLTALAKEIEYTVKNTFIDYPAWESLRNPSLEGFFQERDFKSCPATRVQSLDGTLEGVAGYSDAKTSPVEHQAMRSISLEECLQAINAKYQDMELLDDVISTKANTNEDTAPATPEILSDSESEAKPRILSLSDTLGLWSEGSAQHSSGTCKPCAFLWKDESGCQNGANCKFCHMCPPGEVKNRKKQKLAMRKMVRRFHEQRVDGYYGMFLA